MNSFSIENIKNVVNNSIEWKWDYMEISVTIFWGILFVCIIFIIELFRLYYLNKRIETLDWFLVSLGFFNGVGFIFVLWATLNGYNTWIWTSKILDYDVNLITIYFSLNIILMLSVLLGWIFINSFSIKNNNSLSSHANYNNIQILYIKTKRIALFMLIISILSYILYSRAYGGLRGLIHYSRIIRSGYSIKENKFSFLQRFGGLSFFSAYLYFALLIDKDVRKWRKKSILTGFLVSIGFSIFVLYSWVGRISFIVFILTFLLGIVLYRNKSIVQLSRKLFRILILGLLLIIYFDRILNRSKIGINSIELFVKELSFPTASFITQFKIKSFSWFKDIIVCPLLILPSRIWNNKFNINTASMINTIDFFGGLKGEGGITGSIPVDLLTFSYMQASILGIVVVGFVIGIFLSWLEKVIKKIPLKGIRAVILSNIILNVIILTVIYADPLHIITRNFNLIIGVLLLKLSFSSKKVKRY